MKKFWGYHSEWNLGSPGGWDYQRMAQELGKLSWERIKKLSGIEIELDFDHPLLNPVPAFAELLLRAHRNHFNGKLSPFIVLVAEEETLEKVGENIRFVSYLNSLPGISAALVPPHKIEAKDKKIFFEGRRITVIFLDFNNNVVVKLKKKDNITGLLQAIKQGIVVNPRGMEPIGAKGVFEVITGQFQNLISETTVSHTPWTRQFYQRATIGPSGEEISSLVEWTRQHWEQVILKPVHGYSGKGILIGYQQQDRDRSIQHAVERGGYIIQPLLPLNLWAEEYPWIDYKKKTLFIKRWQTDFRCFITDIGLIGFVTRFGGVPTNVGSGGGVQSTAILRSQLSVKDAINRINETIIGLGYENVSKIQDEINNRSVKMGNVYLLGPIMTTLRPRIITPAHLEQLKEYSQNLWQDAVKLEELWQTGELVNLAEITKEEEQIARLQPWNGSTALIAADGLFNFGGGVKP